MMEPENDRADISPAVSSRSHPTSPNHHSTTSQASSTSAASSHILDHGYVFFSPIILPCHAVLLRMTHKHMSTAVGMWDIGRFASWTQGTDSLRILSQYPVQIVVDKPEQVSVGNLANVKEAMSQEGVDFERMAKMEAVSPAQICFSPGLEDLVLGLGRQISTSATFPSSKGLD